MQFPLLKDADRCYWYSPRYNARKTGVRQPTVYLSAGDTEGNDAFWTIHVHGVDPEVRDSAALEIVEDLEGGQFDLLFDSFDDLRSFFAELVDELERRYRSRVSQQGDGGTNSK